MISTKISVIIPVFNKAKFLRKCIDSVLASDFKDYEIICIDDCSTDGSSDILRDIQKTVAKIKVINKEENSGAGISRNNGLRIASGKYVFFLDADDWVDKYALRIYYDYMESLGAQMCFLKFKNEGIGISGSYSGIYKGTEIIKRFVGNDENFLFACGAMYRRDFLIEKNLQFENLKIGEGGLFVLQALWQAERVCVCEYEGYLYNVNETSTNKQNSAMMDAANGQLRQILFVMNLLADTKDNDEALTMFLDWYLKKHIGGVLNFSNINAQILGKDGRLEYDEFVIKLLTGEYVFNEISIEKDIEKQIIKKGKVYLYGAGYEILSAIRYCHRIGVEISGVLVSTLNGNRKNVYGYRVEEFNKDSLSDYSIPIIITAHKKHQEEIKRILSAAGAKYIATI